jgi:hypothetical protein
LGSRATPPHPRALPTIAKPAGIDHPLAFLGNVHEEGALTRVAEQAMPLVHPA